MSMMNTSTSYGSVTRFFHWFLALLIIVMLTVGLLMGSIGSPLVYKIHKFTGLVVLATVLLHSLWNCYNMRPTYPATVSRPQQIIARAVQHSMLLCAVIMPLSGWIFATAAGKPPQLGSLLLPLPGISQNTDLVSFFVGVHNYVAFILIGLVSIHILAALTHHFVLKDNVLKTMLKG